MASYVSSSDNRYYVCLEQAYGNIGAVTAANRFPGVKLTARQESEQRERRDKTGSRTFQGLPAGLRRRTKYTVQTYMTDSGAAGQEPGYGAFFRAGMGAAPTFFNGGTAGSGSSTTQVHFTTAHGLTPGQAIECGDELRFVAGVVDATTVLLSAPLSAAPNAVTLGATTTYKLARELGSVSIFDYWDPGDAVHRIVRGAAVDKLKVKVNGDFHEFEFSGPASDLVDSASFASGEGNLETFPGEPNYAESLFNVVPGNLGQVWMGPSPEQFFTLTEAEITIDNDIALRDREFGSQVARGMSPGKRSVTANLSLYAMTDEATKALYQAARQRSPISMTIQLGQQAGQLCGVYLKSVVPEVPEFDDGDRRLSWKFSNCKAQGTADDEIYIAFG